MPITIKAVDVFDIRFPTSRQHIGSDAMHPDPDYSAAYCIIRTDSTYAGHGLTFTIGRGNELCAVAVRSLSPLIVGRTLESFTADMAGFWRTITGDSQLRWVVRKKELSIWQPPRSSTRYGISGPKRKINHSGNCCLRCLRNN